MRNNPLPLSALRSFGIATLLLLGAVTPNHSDALSVNPSPSNFQDAQNTLNEIEDDLSEEAQCGGWMWDKSIGDFTSPSGTCSRNPAPPCRSNADCEALDLGSCIFPEPEDDGGDATTDDGGGAASSEPGPSLMAFAWGVPGRQLTNPLANAQTGIGEKSDSFEYPGDAWGYLTACRPASPRPWTGADDRHMPPFFDRHACQRPADDIQPEDVCNPAPSTEKGEEGVIYSCGGGEMSRNTTPSVDGGLCEELNNRWQYYLFIRDVLETSSDDEGNTVTEVVDQEYRRGMCGDPSEDLDCGWGSSELNDEKSDILAEPPEEKRSKWRVVGLHYCCTDHPVGSQWANCIGCQGNDCRSQYNTGIRVESPKPYSKKVIGGRSFRSRVYISYFRHYVGGYLRDIFNPSGYNAGDFNDTTYTRQNVPVACYGMYYEFNPLLTRVFSSWKRCVIAVYYDDIHFYSKEDSDQNAPETQILKGDYGQDSDLKDPPFEIPERDDEFTGEDIWYQNLANGLSLVNSNILRDDLDYDLTFPLLAPDDAIGKAGVQITVDAPISGGKLIRAFDDTGERSVTEWWQYQETLGQRLINPPDLFVIAPSAWSIGLDISHPLFQAEKEKVSPDNRLQSIEIQTETRDDLMGDIADYMLRTSLLQIDEEVVPIVVPLLSATQLRADAEAWRGWKAQCEAEGNCDISGVDAFIEQLNAYAERVDYVRELRGELAQYVGMIVQHQNKIVTAIGDWLLENATAYQEYRTMVEGMSSLATEWRNIQGTYDRGHDQSFPWCRNDRFTPAIYSLLDPWMRGRPDLSGDSMPSLSVPIMNDILIDLSGFKAATGSLKLPVLKPIQIRMAENLTAAPSIEVTAPEIPTLPELPPINLEDPSIKEYLAGMAPTVGVIKTPPVVNWPAADLLEIVSYNEQQMSEIKSVIRGINAVYRKFWDSLLKDYCPEVSDPDDGGSGGSGTGDGGNDTSDDGGGQGTGTNPQLNGECVVEGGEEDCYTINRDNCVHTEMDLIERFIRIGARPGVQLLEDYYSRGYDIQNPAKVDEGVEHCQPEDWACQDYHNLIEYPRWGWKLTGPFPVTDELSSSSSSSSTSSSSSSSSSFDPEIPLCNLTSNYSVEDRGDYLDQLRSCFFDLTLYRSEANDEDLFPYNATREAIAPSFNVPPSTGFYLTADPPMCGDDECNPGESCQNCEEDCGVCECGNDTCDEVDGEDCFSCEEDCGTCDPNICNGNGTCTAPENCSNCSADCGFCSPPG